LSATVVVAAEQPAQRPTFRSEINYVQLPVRVVDARGQFVSGLTQTDFEVVEDGTAQTITTFLSIDIPFIRPQAVTGVPDVRLPTIDPAASGDATHVDGRVYVFMLDNYGSSEVTLRMRQVVRGFINDRLSANDVAAVTMTGRGRGQDFTRDRRLLNAAVGRFFSNPDPFRGRESTVHEVLTRIANTAESLGSIKGRRKAIILVTASSICSLNEEIPGSADSGCREGLRHALRMAVQSDVSIYTVDPRGLVATHGAPAEIAERPASFPLITWGPFDGARYLAEESGGFAVANTNDLSRGFDRIVRENSSYYLLGYHSTNANSDGKFRKTDVTVPRREVQVVHRRGYLAPHYP
jgi:VWFA-related protein